MKAPLLTPPCPWCGKGVDISACTTRRWVLGLLETHLYCGGLHQPRPGVCTEKFAASFGGWEELPRVGTIGKCKDGFVGRPEEEATWIAASIKFWRRKSPGCTLLSDRELLRRQRLAGKRQARKWKALGAKNQSVFDKILGGEKAAHLRWHVARGIHNSTCKLCNPP